MAELIELHVNGKRYEVRARPQTRLLWVLRDELGLRGTKFGCGRGLCGACTVHVDGVAARSCSLPLAAIGKAAITTIEGLGGEHPVQRAWVEHDVPQCGYCQPGQIMQATSLLRQTPHPDAQTIDEAMAGNICRCGTYPRIRRAIAAVASGGKR